MKLKSLNKEIMAMLLSATFLFTSLPAVSSFADEVSTNDNKVVQADKEKKKVKLRMREIRKWRKYLIILMSA